MKKELCYKRKDFYFSRWLLFISVSLFAISACKEERSNLLSTPVIQSPREGALFFIGEAIWILAEVAPGPEFSHMEIYLDESFLFETDQHTVDTLIRNQSYSEGLHEVKVIAFDTYGITRESTVNFQFETILKDSEDEESFKGLIKGWSLSGWEPTSTYAYDDQVSLLSSSDRSIAVTRKQFKEPGSISFYVKTGYGNLKFIVDGELKAKWFGHDDWGYYAYSIPAGTHVFRWEGGAEGTYIDKVIFSPGVEQHTTGEIYEGGTIFYLDSTGLHGLIAALEDGTYEGNYEIPWGCYGLNILSGNRAQSMNDGEGNTRAIVSDCNWEQIAARFCDEFITSGDSAVQDDWYLPAIMELNILHSNRDILEGLGGEYYWSSTSFSMNAASVINFIDGSPHGAHRNIPNISGPSTAGIHVRPIRKF